MTMRHSCSGRREDQLARWSGGDGESTNELLISGDGGVRLLIVLSIGAEMNKSRS